MTNIIIVKANILKIVLKIKGISFNRWCAASAEGYSSTILIISDGDSSALGPQSGPFIARFPL